MAKKDSFLRGKAFSRRFRERFSL